MEYLVHTDSVIRGRFYFFWLPTDYADLHRWLRYWMLSVGFCEISGRDFSLLALRAGRPQITQICTDGYAAGCYLWDSVRSVGDLYVAVDFTMDAMFHVGRVEIDKETDGFVSQTQVGEQLLVMDGFQFLYGFQFDDYRILHK